MLALFSNRFLEKNPTLGWLDDGPGPSKWPQSRVVGVHARLRGARPSDSPLSLSDVTPDIIAEEAKIRPSGIFCEHFVFMGDEDTHEKVWMSDMLTDALKRIVEDAGTFSVEAVGLKQHDPFMQTYDLVLNFTKELRARFPGFVALCAGHLVDMELVDKEEALTEAEVAQLVGAIKAAEKLPKVLVVCRGGNNRSRLLAALVAVARGAGAECEIEPCQSFFRTIVARAKEEATGVGSFSERVAVIERVLKTAEPTARRDDLRKRRRDGCSA